MKLLLCSDLHAEPVKIRGIIAGAINNGVDLVCCAGDLIDFTSTKIGPECNYVRAMIRDKHTRLDWAVCSGNHDYFLGEETPTTQISPAWMTGVGTIQDGQTQRFARNGQEILVTTVPWPLNDSSEWQTLTHNLLETGKHQSEQTGASWLILAHEPPAGEKIGAGYQSWRAELTTDILKSANPDYLLCGHIHHSPMGWAASSVAANFQSYGGGDWIQQIGDSVCFNAGQSDRKSQPWYIILELFDNGVWKADHSHF